MRAAFVLALALSLAAPSAVRPAFAQGEDASSGVTALAPGAPALASPSAVLMDALSGRILLAKNPHDRRNPASVTKLMTLAVALDALAAGQVGWSDPVTTSPHAASMGGSQVFLSPGETFSFGDLVAAVAIASANDAAMAVAEHVAGSEEGFVRRMQALAEAIGMRDSTFRNPHGLDADGHVMSAYDIALLSRYLILRHPELLRLTRTWMRPFREPPREFVLVNTNKLLKRYPGVDGLKTGWTSAAGYSVSITAQRGETRLVAVVLGAPTAADRWSDITRMLDWGFANFASVVVARAGETVGRVAVDAGRARAVAVAPASLVAVTVGKGEADEVESRLELPARVAAPVAKGDVLGRIVVRAPGQSELSAPLAAQAEVPRAGLSLLLVRLVRAFWPF
ncbi:MAG: D-alanyl-D-alanine carboxypeptidase [Clostridia bacterium]|nr:D-alanyl-D-alanine carboxypeptidase [Clostridia bacterium]